MVEGRSATNRPNVGRRREGKQADEAKCPFVYPSTLKIETAGFSDTLALMTRLHRVTTSKSCRYNYEKWIRNEELMDLLNRYRKIATEETYETSDSPNLNLSRSPIQSNAQAN